MLKLFRMLLISTLFFIGIIILYRYNPAASSIYPPCPFRYLTGYYCPGCGSLRAMHQLLHGHLLIALDLNPFMVLSLPFVIYLLVSQLHISIGGRLLFKRVLFRKPFYISLLTAIFFYWILRNIPIYPFSVLAP